MTSLRSTARLVVLFIALAGITAAAVPAGWIALKHVPAQGEQKGYWVIVKMPAAGLAAWWSDAELAKIMANDPDYVKHLETDWTPTSAPLADPVEAKSLAEELARYWGGDLPQMNFWAHGALTRRGSTPRAYGWEQQGLSQRTELERKGERPSIPAAPLDPNPIDQRFDNRSDVVTYGDRWGSHLRTETLDHVYTSERNKAQRRHHPSPPPAGEITQKARETIEACRQASLQAEMGVFENYVRGWGGLGAKSVTFGLPANCVANPGPLAVAPPQPTPPVTPPVRPPSRPVTPPVTITPPTPPTPPVTPPVRPPSRPVTPPVTITPPTPPTPPVTPPVRPPSRPVTPPVTVTPPTPPTPPVTPPTPPQRPVTPPTPPPPTPPPTPPVKPPVDEITYNDCKGNVHSSQSAADAVNCDPPTLAPPQNDPQYTACDGTLHWSQADADAIPCYAEETDELCEQDPFAAGCDSF